MLNNPMTYTDPTGHQYYNAMGPFIGDAPVDGSWQPPPPPGPACEIEVRANIVHSSPIRITTFEWDMGGPGDLWPLLDINSERAFYHLYIYTRDPSDQSVMIYEGDNPVRSWQWEDEIYMPLVVEDEEGELRGTTVPVKIHGTESRRVLVFQKGDLEELVKSPGDVGKVVDQGDAPLSCDAQRAEFEAIGQSMNSSSRGYNALGPNSNTLVRELLEGAGLPAVHPYAEWRVYGWNY